MTSTPPPASSSPSPRPSSWIAGAILILLGTVFLLNNLTGFSLGSWWALFLLIPVGYSLAAVVRSIQEHGGRLTASARGPLVGALVLLTVMAVFLFNLDWGKIWPVFLIIAGLGALFSSLFPEDNG
jgi:hypothetical protein